MYNKGEEQAVNYVLGCRCKGGGFCFYRLEEPNASDTYWALSILNLLDINFRDDATVAYLKNLQEANGTYQTIFLAYYSIKGLLLLRERTEHDPTEYIKRNIRIYDVNRIPAGTISIFKWLYCVIDLCFTLNIKVNGIIKNGIIKFILKFHGQDKGFGYTRSTLIETSHALSILKWLDYPMDSLETKRFIKECESSVHGFSNIPNTAPSFIEHIHAGVIASSSLSYKLRYREQCVEFIKGCQNNNGGFARSSYGISTLENTYYAIHSLSVLNVIALNH